MKTILYVFLAILFVIEISQPLEAVNTPNEDAVEAMLKRVEKNLNQASAITLIAKNKGEKLVSTKIVEKKKLKESVQKLSKQVEVFAERMNEAGLDTSLSQPIEETFKYQGPLYEEWLEYQKNGGESDFEYYRLYKK